jgi:hypothetical protein
MGTDVVSLCRPVDERLVVIVMNSEIQLLHPRHMDAKETAEEGKRKLWRFYEHELSAWLFAQSKDGYQAGTSSSIRSARIVASCLRMTKPHDGSFNMPEAMAGE